MAGRFTGRVALVTGGSNGLGRAITQAFLDQGARVGILDLEQYGGFAGDDRVVTVTGDVAEPDSAAQAIAAAVEHWGAVDFLINDAASYPDGLVLDMALDTWRRVWDVNMTGMFLCCRAFARHRLERGGGGKIVSISSG